MLQQTASIVSKTSHTTFDLMHNNECIFFLLYHMLSQNLNNMNLVMTYAQFTHTGGSPLIRGFHYRGSH